MDLWTENYSRPHLNQQGRDSKKIILSYNKHHCSNHNTVGNKLFSNRWGVWILTGLPWGRKCKTVISPRRIWDVSLFRDLQSIFQDRAQAVPNRGQKPTAREGSLIRKATVLQGWSTEFWCHVCTASSPFHCVNPKQHREDSCLLFSLLTAILLKTSYTCSVDVSLTIKVLSYSTSSAWNQSSQSSKEGFFSPHCEIYRN